MVARELAANFDPPRHVARLHILLVHCGVALLVVSLRDLLAHRLLAVDALCGLRDAFRFGAVGMLVGAGRAAAGEALSPCEHEVSSALPRSACTRPHTHRQALVVTCD